MDSLKKFLGEPIIVEEDGEKIKVDPIRAREYALLLEFRALTMKENPSRKDLDRLNDIIVELVYNGLKPYYPDLEKGDVYRFPATLVDKVLAARMRTLESRGNFRGVRASAAKVKAKR